MKRTFDRGVRDGTANIWWLSGFMLLIVLVIVPVSLFLASRTESDDSVVESPTVQSKRCTQVDRIETTQLIPIEQINTIPVERIETSELIPFDRIKTSGVEQRQQPVARAVRYESVGEYFREGNPNPTTYRLGEPWILRKSFSAKQRAKIHKENGGCCQVCGSTSGLEVEHWRGLQNGGGNERANLKTLCRTCHNQKTKMDNSLRRQRDKLLKARK